MKKILVIDESAIVRETLALILGREFVVEQRSPQDGRCSFTDGDRDVDLLILGVTPAIGAEASSLPKFAARLPFATLFLVDSHSAASALEERETIAVLAKPFNPYELKAKVKRLLAREALPPKGLEFSSEEKKSELAYYLEFPYLSRAHAELARKFAATGLPILITGETGCGQEQVARAIHALEDRAGPCLSLYGADVSEAYLAQRSAQISSYRRGPACRLTLLIEDLDRVAPQVQAALSAFLDDEEAKGSRLRLLTTARTELLEKVYQGRFLESLYYRLATLTLRLPPLRERLEDLPALANWFTRRYGERLAAGSVSLSSGAVARLGKYLWFGNLREMEAVIARTIAVHRKARIEAADLYLESTEENPSREASSFVPSDAPEPAGTEAAGRAGDTPPAKENPAPGDDATNGKSADLKLLVHELAHELKNPMVTIKTFTQLLGERYQDESFRARFQDIVDGDIERIDDLLELMIEFANFSQPEPGRIPLQNHVRSVLREIASECVKRQAQVRWKGEGQPGEILADEGQVKYVLKHALLAVVSQVKLGSEIEIDVERPGALNISYVRQGGRISPVTYLFDLSAGNGGGGILPLRILLAKQLVERNGGKMAIDHREGEQDILRMEFPIA